MTIKIKDIIQAIEEIAPLGLQESYDNSGLLLGDKENEISSVLLCFDVNEEIIQEAINLGAGLIISHHPPIFSGLKKIVGSNLVERIVIKAIKSDIAIYSAHTNLDSSTKGINYYLANILNLHDIQVLAPIEGMLYKLITYVPNSHSDVVRNAMFMAGAGKMGKYDKCSYNINGEGTFRAGEGSTPFVGSCGELHCEREVKIETIVNKYDLENVIKALKEAHPYEEPAFDIFKLENTNKDAGIGAIGFVDTINTIDFLSSLKKKLSISIIKHNKLFKDKISKVAVCGGSGSSFITSAIASKADIYITGDCKYHNFIDTEDKIILVDAGHFETECFAQEIINEVISKKFPNFAVYLSALKNPVHYM